MAQHDNGRRPAGQQSGAWQQGQQGQREPQDFSNAQQDQSGGRYASQYGGGQQGGHDQGGSRGHQDQFDDARRQQGDNWRERAGPASGGWRPAMEESDRDWNAGRSGQGSFGGQASDNDFGNRGITESGNFGNYGSQRDNYGPMSGQGRWNQGGYGRGGNYDQGGQSGQRFGGYRQGYDARSDSTGGYGSSNYGADNESGGDWNARRAWRDEGRQPGFGSTYGQSAADNYQGNRGWQGAPGNRDRYGDNGYQGNFQQGQRGQSYHDPDYHQWRGEQLARLDRDYDEWRQHRYQRFSEDFDNWRANRDNDPNRGGRSGTGSTSGTSGTTASGSGTSQQASSTSDTSGQQAGTSRHDASNGGDKSSGKTATK